MARLFKVYANTKSKLRKKIEIPLLVISSMLLGIWAVKDTIALRNVLLCVGFLASIFYLYSSSKELKIKNSVSRAMLFVLAMIFIWVLLHYFFLAKYVDAQWDELRTTWLRSLFAVVIGLATGILFQNRSRSGFILYLGILLSFCVVFFQYIRNAIEIKEIFVVDFTSYIYLGKINAVLMGLILLAIIFGILLDQVNTHKISIKRSATVNLFVFLIVVYSYVNIFDTRNGLALSILLLTIFAALNLYLLAKKGMRFKVNHKAAFILVLVVILFLGLMIKVQVERKSGWGKLISDGKIAIQIDEYQNWKNPSNLGYPRAKDGSMVDISNYERISWVAAGLRLVSKTPLGLGVLGGAFEKQIDSDIPIGRPPSTHSGWLDLTLSFGIPFLILIILLFTLIMYSAITSSDEVKYLSMLLCMVIAVTYLMGELSSKHAVEILFFNLGLLVGLQSLTNSTGMNLVESNTGIMHKV